MLLVVLTVTVASVLFSLQGDSEYEATSQVLLSDQDLAGCSDRALQGGVEVDAERFAATQAESRGRRFSFAASSARPTRTASLRPMSCWRRTSPSSTERIVLEFSVIDGDPLVAQRLATAYAQQFVLYSRELETAAIERARIGILGEMEALARQGGRDSALYSRLAAEAQTLRTAAALRTSKAQLLRPAEEAEKVSPRPKRAAVFGFVAALLLAAAVVAVLRRSTRGVRSETDIAQVLGVPLMGRIAEPPGRLRRDTRVAVLEDPDGAVAESFRICANLEYANAELNAKVVIFTSSVRGEGKSTTVANIAASFARLGKRVVLVDLDLRRPTIQRRFGITGTVGVSDVARGRVQLDDAIVRVPIQTRERSSSNGRIRRWTGSPGAERPTMPGEPTAVLEVLPAGSMPNDVGEFVASQGIADVLHALRDRADLVFVDAPPVLEVSDPMTLIKHVDALVAVARLGVIRQPMSKSCAERWPRARSRRSDS